MTVSVLRVEYDPVLMRSKKLVSGTEYDLHNYANTSTKSLREFEFSFENSQKFSAVVMWRTCLRGTHFSPSIELNGWTASKNWLLTFKIWRGGSLRSYFCRQLDNVAIYTLYPESFCVKNLALRKAFAFSDSATLVKSTKTTWHWSDPNSQCQDS